MAEPPLPAPVPLPPLPQPLPPLPQPPSPPIPPAAVPPDLSSTASSARPLMAEPPPAFPQPPMLLEVVVATAPRALLSTASSMGGVAPPTSPPDHVARNPRIGDSSEVESGAGASMAEALSEITTSSTLSATHLPQVSKPHEEDGVDNDGSTSLSAICERLIQSCTYTVDVKICSSETEINGYASFSWQIVEEPKKNITKAICTLPLLPCTSETETALALLPCSNDAIVDNVAKSTSSKTTSKSKRSKIISAAPDSPAMSTRSKKRAAPNSQAMATRSKKKLKL